MSVLLDGLISAGVAGLAAAAAFALLARLRLAVAQLAPRFAPFRHELEREAGRRHRAAVADFDQRAVVAALAGIVFVVAAALAYALRPSGWLGALTDWLPAAGVVALIAAVIVRAAWWIGTLRRRRRLLFERNARIVIGNGLSRSGIDGARTFFEVDGGTAEPCIDGVIVGTQGVFAVHVVAIAPSRRERRRPYVTVDGTSLVFGGAGRRHSLKPYLTAVAGLARELAAAAGSAITVRPVVAVPGWQIREQTSDRVLLVNEERLSMIRGWADASTYLMNEQADAVAAVLRDRCRGYAPV